MVGRLNRVDAGSVKMPSTDRFTRISFTRHFPFLSNFIVHTVQKKEEMIRDLSRPRFLQAGHLPASFASFGTKDLPA